MFFFCASVDINKLWWKTLFITSAFIPELFQKCALSFIECADMSWALILYSHKQIHHLLLPAVAIRMSNLKLIHYLTCLSCQGLSGSGAKSSELVAILYSNSPNLHEFGLWEETRAPESKHNLYSYIFQQVRCSYSYSEESPLKNMTP